MANVITVMNMKGGVGKTTVSANLGGLIAWYKLKEKFRNVLIIDYDPQFNLSQTFIEPKTYFDLENNRKTTISILIEDDSELNPFQLQVIGNENPPSVNSITHNVFRHKTGNKLDIVPSTLDLMYIALGSSSHKSMEERFSKFIYESRKLYDLIIIDCHPAGSLFTKTSLHNSDYVLIPVAPQPFAIRGIALMTKFISAKGIGKSPKPIVLFNNVSRTGISDEERTIRSDNVIGKFCLNTTLKNYKAFSDPLYGKGFVWTSRKPYSTEAFHNLYKLANEIVGIIEK